ncbi:tellurite resistance TerB family protein [Actinomycetospora flava]|uniref:TerB N-terminal domain-containing protein n=1 Tax=Actinomycetospora flava TaxID=3129232 RepID=A0ABU8M7G5_9PSEU
MTASATASQWAGAGEPVVVAGATLEGIYTGPATAPEVIDPGLPVDFGAPDWEADSVIGPPHYGELTPAARAAFLVWQRTGRRAEQAPAVWALLHLYGLERRILVDGDSDPELSREAAALGETYGSDPEVARVAKALGGHRRPDSPPPLDDEPVPDVLQVELGHRALASEPVDADWALAWAWFHPDIARREAAKRVPEDFARLWRYRFIERHPEGLPIRPRRRRLTLDYTPANPSLPVPLELSVPDASDVFLTTGPAVILREITDQVEADLIGVVRWRNRYPDEPITSARAAAVLPEPLFAGSSSARAVRPFVEQAESLLTDVPSVVDAETLLSQWTEATGTAEIERRDAVEMAQVLERFGVGVEPDVRFGGRAATRSPVVLFRQAESPTTSPSEAYAAAVVVLELCAAVAGADGVVDDTEQAMLIEQVQLAEGITASERTRLDAHRVLVASSELRLADVAARMVGLPLTQRLSLGSYVLDLARADGVVTDDEVRVLRSVHELLDLDPDEVDRRLRFRRAPLAPRAAPTAELFTLQPTHDDSDALLALAPAENLVESEAPAERLVAVDETRLRQRQADNLAVQDLLGAIFADVEDEADEPEPAVVDTAAGATGIATLDATHSALLRELAGRGQSSRQDLEALAARHGVLPDGAVDVINEAALDSTEEPVIEVHDDESVTVDSAIYEEMRA